MRKIGNFGDEVLQSEQLQALTKLLSETRSYLEMKALLNAVLTESERSAISQRLAIIRMHCKGFKYSQIEETLKTATNTITKAVMNYEKDTEYRGDFDHILKHFRFDPKSFKEPDKAGSPGGVLLPSAGVGARAMIRQSVKEMNRK
jgi:Trp operon repressor